MFGSWPHEPPGACGTAICHQGIMSQGHSIHPCHLLRGKLSSCQCIALFLDLALHHTWEAIPSLRPKYTNPSIQTSIHPRWRVRNTVQYTTSTAEGKHESHIPHHGVRKLQHVRNYRADSAFRLDNLLIWCRSWTAADMFCDILDQNLFQWQHVCFFLKKSLSSFLFGLTWELLCESGSAYESIIH